MERLAVHGAVNPCRLWQGAAANIRCRDFRAAQISLIVGVAYRVRKEHPKTCANFDRVTYGAWELWC